MLLLSYNVAGWATTLKQIVENVSSLQEWLQGHQIDILCLQEVKTSVERLRHAPQSLGARVAGFETFWACCTAASKPGKAVSPASGVATFARAGSVIAADPNPLGDPDLDQEGRCLLTDHGDFVLLNVYAPAGGEGYARLPHKLRFLRALSRRVGELRASGRHVVLAGDLNVAPRPHDVWWRHRVLHLPTLWGAACNTVAAGDAAKLSGRGAPSEAAGGLPQPPCPASSRLPGALAAKLREAQGKVEAALAVLRIEKIPGKRSGRPGPRARANDSWQAYVALAQGGAPIAVGRKMDHPREAQVRWGRRLVLVSDVAEAGGEVRLPPGRAAGVSALPSAAGSSGSETPHSVRGAASCEVVWREGWLSVEHLQDVARVAAPAAALSDSEAALLADRFGESYYAPALREWFERELVAGAGLVDTFTEVHGGARERFTVWDQATNGRYENRGVRIDLILADPALARRVLRGAPLAAPPADAHLQPAAPDVGLTGGGADVDSAASALWAATEGGLWRAAPFDGTGMAEAPAATYRRQFRAPHTGIVYTPPHFSDHVAVSLLLDVECPRNLALRSDPATRAAQPHRHSRAILDFFQPLAAPTPSAPPAAPPLTALHAAPPATCGVEGDRARGAPGGAALALTASMLGGDGLHASAVEGKAGPSPDADPHASAVEGGGGPPPGDEEAPAAATAAPGLVCKAAPRQEPVGRSSADPARARNYRDSLAQAGGPGRDLGDYWRQRRWVPEQLRLSEPSQDTPGAALRGERGGDHDPRERAAKRSLPAEPAEAPECAPRAQTRARVEGPGGRGHPPGPREEGAQRATHYLPPVFVLDIVESGGAFRLHGVQDSGEPAVIHVHDYSFSLHIPAPAQGGGGGDVCGAVRAALAATLAGRGHAEEGAVREVALVRRTPLLHFRAHDPAPQPMLCVRFGAAVPEKQAAGALRSLMQGGCRGAAAAAGGGEGPLERAHIQWAASQADTVYEEGVKLLGRFMHDTRLSGGSWVAVATPCSEGGSARCPGARAPASVTAPWRALQSMTRDAATRALEEAGGVSATGEAARVVAERDGLAPLRMLAVEVLQMPQNPAVSPTPQDDPVVMIVCVKYGEWLAGRDEPAEEEPHAEVVPGSVVFTWGGSGHAGSRATAMGLGGARVVDARTERDMLAGWIRWLTEEADPDVLAVFQVQRSFRALKARCERCGLGAPALGRGPGALRVESVVMYSAEWVKSKAMGRMAATSNQETFKAAVEGRLVLDVQRVALSALLLPTYDASAVAAHVLGAPLEVLPWASLHAMWHAGAHGGRPRVARYALAQAGAVRDMATRLGAVEETVEVARCTGLTLLQVLYNAQMARVWSMIQRAARLRGFMPAGHRDEAAHLTESPYLMHPLELGTAGLYEDPVVVLDFASLYPSLFAAYNLCYSTLVPPEAVRSVPEAERFTAPSGAVFVRSARRRGVLPQLLAGLVAARRRVREELKQLVCADDAVAAQRGRVLEGRQRALKLVANAVYGFAGARPSPLRSTALADACLSLGAAACHRAREALQSEALAAEVAREAALQAGAPSGQCEVTGAPSGRSEVAGAPSGRCGGMTGAERRSHEATLSAPAQGLVPRVVYAQTDSLFVLLEGCSADLARRLGPLLAQLATRDCLPRGLRLTFERVLCPFLLLHVNRYAGRALDPPSGSKVPPPWLLVKGVKSEWRLSPPFVRRALTAVLQAALLREPGGAGARAATEAALRVARGTVRALLSGEASVGDLVMTGGLWRVTGKDIHRAGDSGGDDPGAPAAELRGPHVHLAVRLRAQDPGREFVLGERIPYVLMAGGRTQEESAADPLEALRDPSHRLPNYLLYFRNKLLPPLQEILSHVASPHQLHAFLTGDHTRVAVSSSTPRTSCAAGDSSDGAVGHGQAWEVHAARQVEEWTCRRCTLINPGTSTTCGACSAHAPNRGSAQVHLHPRIPGGARGESHGARMAGPGRKQCTLGGFVVSAPKCVACRSVLPATPMPLNGRLARVGAPALCATCQMAGMSSVTYAEVMRDHKEDEAVLSKAAAACARCHSGGLLGEVICANKGCPNLFTREGMINSLEKSSAVLSLDW
ncbi:hypothetical protein CYMTET_11024 [Cymbomonas tetramitiformis]|uniref:DNA polymerase delta catalytic subunit n=1 Tax=Cymbomonas tetramitiformis TaxID=36881 RepID=A0AAE0GNE9_9CHLO|nr:hypothetical protein CYMTET_11024 [Cymbomonas tetramitiformis]